jgi:hypothetical protein
MLRIVPCLALGLVSASAFASGYLDPLTRRTSEATSFDARWEAAGVRSSLKQDSARLPQNAASRAVKAPAITSVELVGVSNTAVVYRNREGRVIFQHDPSTQTTIVVKGVVLPDVTIRTNIPASSRPAPVPRDVKRDKREKLEKLPIACESPFSAVAAPSLANIPGRCLASGTQQKFASSGHAATL